jgi:protease-4
MSEEHQKSANASAQGQPDQGWERGLMNRLAFASLREQRRARRWGIFFKFLFFGYLVVLLLLYLPRDIMTTTGGGKHTALVELRGVIAEDSEASADRIVSSLRSAFEDEMTAGVIVRINSPGGSPVQAGYINDEIQRLRKQRPDIPIHAVVTDVCASGGYYVAAAADRIYADKSSVIGSIGVLMNGFGFVDAMDKLGVERRLLTAGEHKGLLDPFSPARPDELQHIQKLLDELHAQFIEVVKQGRGERLNSEDKDLFSGLVWSGQRSVELGLVDALGSSSYVAREVIGAEEIVDFTTERDYLERLAERLGVGLARALSAAVSVPMPR